MGRLYSDRHGLRCFTHHAPSDGLILVDTNILKVFIIFVYTLLTIVVFATTSEVLWLIGLIAALGNIVGGYAGAKLTLSKGDKLIRHFLTGAIIAMVVKLIFF